ncbi:MAG: PQQ-binding-like beta-propeller repeat protein [Candidatus Kerfeldbacteria bacterium]
MNKTTIITVITLIVLALGIGGYFYFASDIEEVKPVTNNSQPVPGPGLEPNGQPPIFSPPPDLNAPLPTASVEEIKIYSIGDVEISVYNPITITGLENSTNIYFSAKNSSSTTVTLLHEPVITQSVDGGSDMHLYSMTNSSVAIAGGAEETIEYMSAPFKEGNLTFDVKFTIVESNITETVTVTVGNNQGRDRGPVELPFTATINGTISDESGNPLSGVVVSTNYFNSERVFEERTDDNGNYTINVPSSEDVEALLGDRERAYDTLGFFVYAEKDGYEIGYQDEIVLDRGDTETVDFSLSKVEALDYEIIGETQTDGIFGYWWIMSYDNFTNFAAVQGRHPSELNQPGHIISVDKTGNENWRIDTKDECWGMDVSQDGMIAAACHEGTIYMVDSDGNTKWTLEGAGMSRDIEFSNDGTQVLVGPYQDQNTKADFAILNTSDGTLLWAGSNVDNWLRAARWSADDKYIVVGLAGGTTMLYKSDGTLVWTKYIGEFPMVLEIDDEYNVYAAGKNRELFSYDVVGNLNWRRRIGNHVVTAGADNMSADGSMIVIGTVGAKVMAFNPDGEILWQRTLKGELQGHNALDMTPDGEYIVVGTAGVNDMSGYIHLYNKNGTLLWEKQHTNDRPSAQAGIEFDHNQTGVITVTISDDGKYIASGFGDSSIRIYESK